MSEPATRPHGPLALLAAGASALARGRDLDETLTAIVEAGAPAAGAPAVLVTAWTPERDDLELLVTLGLDDAAVAALAADLARPDHPIRGAAHDRAGTLGRDDALVGRAVTCADLPLVVASAGGEEHCVGVLTLAWPGRHAVESGAEPLLVAFADLAAVAIATFRTAALAGERGDWQERVAQTDALTGIANGRTLARVLDLEIARAERQGGEVSLAVIDLDRFGELNAAAGARAGDRVLREVAVILAESVRLVDTIARTGADEFAVVAPGSAGPVVARRVLDAIGRLDGEGRTLSASAVIARFPRDGGDAATLLAAARGRLAAAEGTAALVEAG